jgi:hypothetical protein
LLRDFVAESKNIRPVAGLIGNNQKFVGGGTNQKTSGRRFVGEHQRKIDTDIA